MRTCIYYAFIVTKPFKVASDKPEFCRQTLGSARWPLVAEWSETVSLFLPRTSNPPYCMTERSVATVTVVANSNRAAELVLVLALGCFWSWVGMNEGMKLLFFFFFFLESFMSPSCPCFWVRRWSETDRKPFRHLLTGDLHKSRLDPATGEGASVWPGRDLSQIRCVRFNILRALS